jgi:hypothetical protein
MLNVNRQLTWRSRVYTVPAELLQMLMLALVFAVLYWVVGLLVQNNGTLFVWGDQLWTFSSALSHLDNPYESAGFFNMPWAMVLLIPFDPLPLELAAFAQIVLYFGLLALVIHKFGGGRGALLVALTSALAVDAALEINIDWMVCIGLLVPPTWSGPFLLIKPQTAFGYVFSFSRRDFVRATLVVLVTVLIAFVLWGNWPLNLLENIRKYEPNILVNIAPMSILPVWLSIGIGVVLGVYAFRKRDTILCVLAGLFFVPYTAPSSVMVAFALLATRWPRAALLVSGLCWLIVIRILLG